MIIRGTMDEPVGPPFPIHLSAWKGLYSITYVDRPDGHLLPGRIETRKGYKDAPDRARAPEIEPLQATQS